MGLFGNKTQKELEAIVGRIQKYYTCKDFDSARRELVELQNLFATAKATGKLDLDHIEKYEGFVNMYKNMLQM